MKNAFVSSKGKPQMSIYDMDLREECPGNEDEEY